MNGRVYDPLLGRFGSPDPMTENPFSTQGWNRYSYVGNSPVNFTDPSGYCFMGCFWQSTFRAIGNFFEKNWVAILQVAATAMCGGNPACAGVVAFAVTGVTSGDLGMAFRAGVTAFITATAFQIVGQAHGGNFLAKMGGHAAVGCLSAVMSGGRCGRGALSAAAGVVGTPFGLVGASVAGGLASVASGGNFGNGAVTAAFGYLFNQCGKGRCTVLGAAGGFFYGNYAWAWATAGTAGTAAPSYPAVVGGPTLLGLLGGVIADVVSDALSGIVHSQAPPANDGDAKPHGGTLHDEAIDAAIEEARAKGATNIRKNQVQADIDGNRVGDNRPDLQYDLNGEHHNLEWDFDPSRSANHGRIIRQNDPSAHCRLTLLGRC